jgi:hypothetical protein
MNKNRKIIRIILFGSIWERRAFRGRFVQGLANPHKSSLLFAIVHYNVFE